MHTYTNKLIHETSPYLLQHAHNPVNWFPWGNEALTLAKNENKPILVSIGYSACHWCHVMERESFEDVETAAIMNKYFINIKIDREERPDLDHVYMDAVQAMTGSGGWPLNVFLTPEGKPFYGGTYFPPARAYNRPSWKEVLYNVHQAFTEKRNEIDAQAESLTEHLIQANSFGISKTGQEDLLQEKKLDEAFQQIMKSADKQWGGFGRAPKFPQSFVIQFLLRYYHYTKNKEALQQALLSVDKMIDGGIYDQIGGGFARYSTDAEWLVPHFEKMLYDNALLLSLISEAYQLTGNRRYREVIDETIDFLKREMLNESGGYYAALDADSEGEEGKFYVWDYAEVKEILKEEGDVFCRFFDITEKGNWEHKNIPWRKKSEDDFCRENEIQAEKLALIITNGKKILLERRNKRTRPATDDKIILAWNALLNTALSKAYAATGNDDYKRMAEENMKFLLDKFSEKESEMFFHSWKNNIARQPAFLDDYAFLIQALINLQEITGETFYLEKASEISGYVIDNFSDKESDYFFYTGKSQDDIILRKKEVYDGAQPSGNAVMADNLFRLGLYFDNDEWKRKSNSMLISLGNTISRYPTSFGYWACTLQDQAIGISEIVLLSEYPHLVLKQLLRHYIPHKILMSSKKGDSKFPLLTGKEIDSDITIFLCKNYACKKPVFTVDELIGLLGHK